VAVVGGRTEEASQRLFDQACRVIPGGVSSPVRAMRSVGRDHPLFVARGEGGWLIDADGRPQLLAKGAFSSLSWGTAVKQPAERSARR
jgi:glutamate-1-semialdehyde 2,1-aminomutase